MLNRIRVLNHLRPRILIVDDEPSIGAFLRRVIESTGEYLVETQIDPFVAVRRAQIFKPDLLILDVNMPGKSGLDVARAIRGEPWLKYRPIVFYTCIPEAEKECYRAGGEGPTVFLPKGTEVSDILRAIERLVAPRLELYRAFKESSGEQAA